MKIHPRRDRSGWFLIEKTTILTNSCCLMFNQPSVTSRRSVLCGEPATALSVQCGDSAADLSRREMSLPPMCSAAR